MIDFYSASKLPSLLGLAGLGVLTACGGGGGGSSGPGDVPEITRGVSPAKLDDIATGIVMETYGVSTSITFDATGSTNTSISNNVKKPNATRSEKLATTDQYRFHFRSSPLTVDVTLPTSGTVTQPGSTNVNVKFRPASGTYDYTAAGVWALDRSSTGKSDLRGGYAFGIPSENSGLQALANQTVTYNGTVSAAYVNATTTSDVTGTAAVTATFNSGATANGTLNGTLSNLTLVDVSGTPALGDITIAGNISGPEIDEKNVTFTSNGAAVNSFDFGAGVSGNVAGAFYGPAGEELGLTFRMTDASSGSAATKGLAGGAALKR